MCDECFSKLKAWLCSVLRQWEATKIQRKFKQGWGELEKGFAIPGCPCVEKYHWYRESVDAQSAKTTALYGHVSILLATPDALFKLEFLPQESGAFPSKFLQLPFEPDVILYTLLRVVVTHRHFTDVADVPRQWDSAVWNLEHRPVRQRPMWQMYWPTKQCDMRHTLWKQCHVQCVSNKTQGLSADGYLGVESIAIDTRQESHDVEILNTPNLQVTGYHSLEQGHTFQRRLKANWAHWNIL